MKRATSLVLMALSALALSACGLRGSLERPEPLWGDPVDHEAEDAGDSDDERR